MLPGKQAEWDEWVGREMETIAAAGPALPGRDHVHTAVYLVAWDAGAVDAIVALDRGYAGVVVAGRADERPRLDLVAAGLAVAVGFRLERTIISAGRTAAARARRSAFVRRRSARGVRRASPHGRRGCGFASPFLATVPGTDTYAADL